jgi:hypothetical protein
MAESATTINENGDRWRYAVPRRVIQRSSVVLARAATWTAIWGCSRGAGTRARANRRCTSARKATPICARCWCRGAQHILGPFGVECDLRRWGLKLAERGGKSGKKRAIIATARKLAVLLHHLWIGGEVYEPLHNHKPNGTAAPVLQRRMDSRAQIKQGRQRQGQCPGNGLLRCESLVRSANRKLSFGQSQHLRATPNLPTAIWSLGAKNAEAVPSMVDVISPISLKTFCRRN